MGLLHAFSWLTRYTTHTTSGALKRLGEKPMKIGIRGQLMLLILGITIPFTLVGVSDLHRTWNTSRKQLNDSIEQQAELAALAFERWVDAQRRPLETIAAIAADRNFESLDIVNYAVSTRPYWVDLTILNASGDPLRFHARAVDPPPRALIDHLLTETHKRNSWVLVTDRAEDESRPIIGLATPIAPAGAVIARIDGGAIDALFSQIQLPSDAVIVVFDSKGQILFRKQTTDTPLMSDVSNSPLFAALGKERVAVVELLSPYDEIRRVYGLCRAGPTDFVIGVGVPSATLYQPMQQQFTRYLFYSFAVVICAVIATIIMQRKIVRPIERLSLAAQRLGKGDFSASAPTHAGGEIGDLGAAFNNMALQIKQREERLTELDRLKSEFVSSVSHELRTPLTTIRTLTHVLQKTNPSEAEHREYLETIAAECDRQIDLVTNLLDLARIESGAYRVILGRVDAVEVIQTCTSLARPAAKIRHLNISTEWPGGTVPLLANETALRRVVSTLLENAVKYTPEGGHIVVGIIESSDSEACIYIKDTGYGIDQADLPYIFERFYRGRTTPSAMSEGAGQQSGVGLGLFVVRGIVEQLKGRISVESEVGRGSRFDVYLQKWTDSHRDLSEEVESVEALAGS